MTHISNPNQLTLVPLYKHTQTVNCFTNDDVYKTNDKVYKVIQDSQKLKQLISVQK